METLFFFLGALTVLVIGAFVIAIVLWIIKAIIYSIFGLL